MHGSAGVRVLGVAIASLVTVTVLTGQVRQEPAPSPQGQAPGGPARGAPGTPPAGGVPGGPRGGAPAPPPLPPITPAAIERANTILAAARAALGGDKLAAVKTLNAAGRTRRVRGNNLVPIEFE